MYIINDIVYAGEPVDDLSVIHVKIVERLCLLVTFNNNEQRIFDCTELLNYPVYQALIDQSVFDTVAIQHGIIVWEDGDIDISTEKVYRMSYPYNNQQII
ncbi:conserved protein of unknown function [Petrocella atlantisensis]|uniref:DUF2442 domain-containing protein n=1 Tax=Petrocella atlantisensis TaxID=2173034 RepID=A0A3P7RZL0_9FIRM|nr:DUF2442 domain-containing protein [Petrocella atlantisensis]VDN47962.1 conserved protein of unknown function [Petrocella atlantisensis]